jgi:hypothetical protein
LYPATLLMEYQHLSTKLKDERRVNSVRMYETLKLTCLFIFWKEASHLDTTVCIYV